MTRTLLLCFIHGFKGDDNTFSDFPQHLCALLSHALPKVSVKAIKYPAFETRGDLHDCVSRFKEWLQNKVIDLEVANGTPSPTVDPSVHTVLVGHSMGGIVAAEAILSILAEQPITEDQDASEQPSSSFMFPYIHGLLAFDTPFLGIAPSVVAHGAQSHWSTASTAYSAYTNAADVFKWGSPTTTANNNNNNAPSSPKLLTAPPSSSSAAATASAAAASSATAPTWQRWGRYAMLAGAAGAVAAGAGAAYANRAAISEGWAWAGSHLEFVGCLARAEELRRRVAAIVALEEARGLGFADVYVCLGKGVGLDFAAEGEGEGEMVRERTFVTVPSPGEQARRFWRRTVHDRATSEPAAHMSLFAPRVNPGYYAMGDLAKELVVEWVTTAGATASGRERWYEEAEGKEEEVSLHEEL